MDSRASSDQLHTQTALAVTLLQTYMTWREGDRVLDVGCGTGEVTRHIAQQSAVASVLGMDLSPQLIVHAESNNTSPKVSYCIADVTDPTAIKPKWRETFTKAVSFYVMHWISDKDVAFRNIFSCLKCNGEFLFNCISDTSSIVKVIRAVEHDGRWRDHLKSRGFTYTIFPWPENDVSGLKGLVEEYGFKVKVCRSRRQRQYIACEEVFRTSVRPFLPHFDYIPNEMHEDVWKIAWGSCDNDGGKSGKIWETNCFEILAKKSP